MIPREVERHDPRILLNLLGNPPANHGEELQEDEAEAYRFLIHHKYLTQVHTTLPSGVEGEANIVSRTHELEGNADELQNYLGQLILD